MLLVLVLLNSGAVGIALASCLINYMTGSSEQHVFNIVTAFISGAFVMAVGDWLGTVLVLATASLLIKVYKR